MSIFISRRAIIPVWVVVFGLLALFASPMPVGTGVLLLIAAILVPAIMLILGGKSSPTVVEVQHQIKASRIKE